MFKFSPITEGETNNLLILGSLGGSGEKMGVLVFSLELYDLVTIYTRRLRNLHHCFLWLAIFVFCFGVFF